MVSSKRLVEILVQDFPNGIDLNNVTEVVIETMRLVGSFKEMSGKKKKLLVLETMYELFDQTDAGEYDKEIDLILKTTVPILIDNLISAEKGELQLNPKIVQCCTCVPK